MPKVHILADRFAGVCDKFVIVLAGSRQVRCVSDVLARWTLENDRRTNLFDIFDTYIYLFCVMTLCGRCPLRNFLSAINRCQY